MMYKFIGVPMSYGCPYPGTELACKVFSERDLAEIAPSKNFEYKEVPCNEVAGAYADNLKCLPSVMACCKALYAQVDEAYENKKFPVVIGGDHALSIGSIAAGYEAFGDDLCIVWIDAHTDINTDQCSESGYIHGMMLAASMGLCCDELTAGKEKCRVKGENIFLIGARSIDDAEYDVIKENNVNLYTADEIKERGMDAVMEEVKTKIKGKMLHVSLDVDFFDPSVFYATGYNIEEGFILEDAFRIAKDLYSVATPVIQEFVEYAPPKDKEGKDFITLKKIMKQILQYKAKSVGETESAMPSNFSSTFNSEALRIGK